MERPVVQGHDHWSEPTPGAVLSSPRVPTNCSWRPSLHLLFIELSIADVIIPFNARRMDKMIIERMCKAEV